LCFKHHNMALNTAASKAIVGVPWHNDGPTPKIDSMSVMID